MYHSRYKGTHYKMGFRWGSRLLECGNYLLQNVPFPITEERIYFAAKCRPYYQQYFPEILEEIRGICEGQRIDTLQLEAILFSMYNIMPENKCSCFAFREGEHIILAQNSDFLTLTEKLNMNCIYQFQDGFYSFLGNTTAFVEMEDGVNQHGLAIGLTSVYPKKIGFGLNAGMLLRYGLERCCTVAEFIQALKALPIASSQTFTVVDSQKMAAVIECNTDRVEVCYLDKAHPYLLAVNGFYLKGMKAYQVEGIDNWQAEERYQTIHTAFLQRREASAISFAMATLGGAYGFLCQYDRKTGKDTVWSTIYDVGKGSIYRCEGNPSRKAFKEDRRFVI